jgi:hypothetical protein
VNRTRVAVGTFVRHEARSGTLLQHKGWLRQIFVQRERLVWEKSVRVEGGYPETLMLIEGWPWQIFLRQEKALWNAFEQY